MPLIGFSAQPGENILYRTIPNRKWYFISWKIISGGIGATILTLILNSLLASVTGSAISRIMDPMFSRLLTNFLFLGVIPLCAVAWVIDDLASTFIGDFVLTDQRIWIRGSPHAWSLIITSLDDVSSMTWHRDAIFIRQKSTHKIQVHMISEGKLFAKAYQDFIQRS